MAKFDDTLQKLLSNLPEAEKHEFQRELEKRLCPDEITIETPRGKILLEKFVDAKIAMIRFQSNVDNETICLAEVDYLNPENCTDENYLNPENCTDEKDYGELCVSTYMDAMKEDCTDKKIVENLKEFEDWQREVLEEIQ